MRSSRSELKSCSFPTRSDRPVFFGGSGETWGLNRRKTEATFSVLSQLTPTGGDKRFELCVFSEGGTKKGSIFDHLLLRRCLKFVSSAIRRLAERIRTQPLTADWTQEPHCSKVGSSLFLKTSGCFGLLYLYKSRRACSVCAERKKKPCPASSKSSCLLWLVDYNHASNLLSSLFCIPTPSSSSLDY